MKSQGLLITLIVFIIITLGLCVSNYFTAKKLQEVGAVAAQASEQAKSAEAEARKATSQLDKAKELVGFPAASADDFLKSMEDELKALAGENAEVTPSYHDTLSGLANTVAQLSENLKQTQIQRDEFQARAEEQEAATTEQKKIFDTTVAQQGSEYKKSAEDAQKRYGEMEKTNHELVAKVDKIDQEAKRQNEEFRTQAADAAETAAAVAQINTNLRDKLDQMHQAEFEVPDGHIVYVDQMNQRVRIDLGKADGLRLLTHFSVFAFDAVQHGILVPKGSIEVVRILGDHEAEALIRSDEMLNPLLPQDVIYTPLWKAGETVQFALDYFLDVDGNGTNDVDTVKKIISSSGSEVAAYIDEDGEIQGTITPNISYFIFGNEQLDLLLKDDFTKEKEQKKRISEAHNSMFEQVRRNSIREMRLGEFLRQVSYRPTAEVSKFQEQGGMVDEVSNPGSPLVSKGNTAPIYSPNTLPEPPKSRGLTAPLYDKKSSIRPHTSAGHVSDIYFQPKNPTN